MRFLDKFGTESGPVGGKPTSWEEIGIAAQGRYTLRPAGLIARRGDSYTINQLALRQLHSDRIEILIRLAWLGGGGSASQVWRGLNIYIKAANVTDYGVLLMLFGSGARNVRFMKYNGTTIQLQSASNLLPAVSVGDDFMIRIQSIGEQLKAKAWTPGSVEPSAWGIETSDSEFTEGYPALSLVDDGSAHYDIRWIGVGTDGDLPPNGDEELASIFPGAAPINGNATAAGGPVDHVLIFRWPQGPIMAQATPDQNGDWSALAPAGEYGVTYISEGCQPITHGPYLAELE